VEAVLTSWYDKTSGGPRGVRIGFHNPSTGKYTYALLVEPVPTSSGMASYKAVKGVHAGGIMWYGNHLYVVDTHVGMRVFDMAKILKVRRGQLLPYGGLMYAGHCRFGHRPTGWKVLRSQIQVWNADHHHLFLR